MRTTTYDEPVVPAVTNASASTGPQLPGASSSDTASTARGHDHTAHPALAALAADVDALVAHLDEVDGWTAVDGLLAIEALVGRLTGISARLLARVEADGLWATAGGRSITDWLAVSAGLSHSRARERVDLSRALRHHLPAIAEEVLAGRVPVAQAQTLAKYATNTEARQAALAAPAGECGEEFLLAHAKEQTADGFRRLVCRWAAAADPEADERGYREASEREFLALSPTTGGMHLTGFLTTEHGAVVGTALEAVMVPPAPDDARTTQQRRAQALVDVAKLTLEHGLVGTAAAVRPHLSVVVDYGTLHRALAGTGLTAGPNGDDDRTRDTNAGHGVAFGFGDGLGRGIASGLGRQDASGFGDENGHGRLNGPECTVGTIAGPGSGLFRLEPVADVERFAVAEIVGVGPIPASVLARLACDGELSRLVFGPDSQVINAGRAERVFTGPRRRAIIARDHTCRYPGCNAPPALGEIHHIEHWARDHGDTDINAGVLLCWYHHDLVHIRHIEIRRSPTGGWTFINRHGEEIRAGC
jgi:hypothetical protein